MPRTKVFTPNEKVFTRRTRRSSELQTPLQHTKSFESFGSVRPLSLQTGTVTTDCVSFSGIGALTALY